MAFERAQFDRDADLAAIYRALTLPETVLERADLPLIAGEQACQSFLATLTTKRAKLSQVGGEVSGNLGFTYGTESDEKSPAVYLRAWLWRQERWWLLFDVVANME